MGAECAAWYSIDQWTGYGQSGVHAVQKPKRSRQERFLWVIWCLIKLFAYWRAQLDQGAIGAANIGHCLAPWLEFWLLNRIGAGCYGGFES